MPIFAAEPLMIAAAADLAPLQKEVTSSIGTAIGVPVRFTFAGSGMLARQIENGAPYDLYLSANEQYVKDLEGQGRLVPGSSKVYATGSLGLWSKSGKIKQISELRGTLAIPNPAHAPYGAAAREMLRRLGLWTRLEPGVVYGENVLQTFQFAQTGNADACITAWSLVRDKGGIRLPASSYPPIRQVGAIVAGSGRQADAARVLKWLTGVQGRQLLARHGLGTP